MEKDSVKKFLNARIFNDYTPIVIVTFYFIIHRFIGNNFICKEFFAIVGIIQAVIFEISLLKKSDRTVHYGKGDFNYFIRQVFISIFFIIATFTLDYYLIYTNNIHSFQFTVGPPDRLTILNKSIKIL